MILLYGFWSALCWPLVLIEDSKITSIVSSCIRLLYAQSESSLRYSSYSIWRCSPFPKTRNRKQRQHFPRWPGILCRHYSPKRLDTSLLRNVFHMTEGLCFHWGGRNSRTMLTPGKRLSSRPIVLARYHPHLKCVDSSFADFYSGVFWEIQIHVDGIGL